VVPLRRVHPAGVAMLTGGLGGRAELANVACVTEGTATAFL
jgi:hypothetical protein